MISTTHVIFSLHNHHKVIIIIIITCFWTKSKTKKGKKKNVAQIRHKNVKFKKYLNILRGVCVCVLFFYI